MNYSIERGSAATKPGISLLLAPLLLGLASGPPARAAEVAVIDDVRHVRNPATPSGPPETIQLEELWRAGGPSDEETIFGLIVDAACDDTGLIYLLDAQLSEVVVYSPEGQRQGTLFREGEGPGEVHNPRALVLLPDGSIGVAQEFPGKLVVVSPAGIPQPSLNAARPAGEDGFVALIAGASRGGNIVLSGIASNRADERGVQLRENFLASFDRQGQLRSRYLAARGDYNYSDFAFDERLHAPTIWWGFTVGPDGRVYAVADFDRYGISVFSADGTPLMAIERECTPAQRSGDEIEAMRRNIANALPPGFPARIEISPTDPAIAYMNRGLHVMEDGSLWVLPTSGLRDLPPGSLQTYDVFDPTGQLIKQVSIVCEGDSDHDVLFLLGGQRALLVRGYLEALAAMFGRGTPLSEDGEEAAPMQVICYRMP